ncbi:hypothetical protein [Vibrio brasiliensis]|nr:hypothetical protein [Vibrio brasiliensis]
MNIPNISLAKALFPSLLNGLIGVAAGLIVVAVWHLIAKVKN